MSNKRYTHNLNNQCRAYDLNPVWHMAGYIRFYLLTYLIPWPWGLAAYKFYYMEKSKNRKQYTNRYGNARDKRCRGLVHRCI